MGDEFAAYNRAFAVAQRVKQTFAEEGEQIVRVTFVPPFTRRQIRDNLLAFCVWFSDTMIVVMEVPGELVRDSPEAASNLIAVACARERLKVLGRR